MIFTRGPVAFFFPAFFSAADFLPTLPDFAFVGFGFVGFVCFLLTSHTRLRIVLNHTDSARVLFAGEAVVPEIGRSYRREVPGDYNNNLAVGLMIASWSE